MFTYKAKSYASGNENIKRVCNNRKCGGTMYVKYGAQGYRCPHCDYKQ